MGAFATDNTLGPYDLRLLERSIQGDRLALREVCRRFKSPIVAVAIRSGCDLDRADAVVEGLLRSLCGQLLAGQIPPEHWPLRLSDEVATHVSTELDGGGDGDNDPEETSPSSFRALPKLARRRAVREALSELPLPELTAILLRNVDGFRLSEMAGLVAQTESQVQATLASAKSLIMRKLRSNVSEP